VESRSPQTVKQFGIGEANQPSILEQIYKDEQAAVT
jgi:hypothetical protein